MTSTESIRDSLVRLFTSNPEAEFHMRGIGRLLGKEPGVFQRAINALVDEGILEDEYRANARFFSLSGTYQPVSERGGSHFDQELKALIDSTADRICSRDTEGALLAWNRAFADSIRELFGVEPYVGLKTWPLITPEQQEQLRCVQEAYRKVYTGETVVAEYEYQMPDGTVCLLETSWAPVWKEGQIHAVGEVTREITHRKKNGDKGKS